MPGTTALITAALIGWCGTVPPVVLPFKVEFPPKRKTCVVCANIAGAAAGVAMIAASGLEPAGAGFLQFAVTAWVAGIVGVSVYRIITGGIALPQDPIPVKTSGDAR